METGDNGMVLHLQEFSAVLDKIIEVIAPERVFCLGVRANRYEEWSMFKLTVPGVSYVTADLVVVISDDDKRRIDEIDDILLKFNSETLQLNAIVHGDAYVRRAVERGSYFFSQVHRKGEMMYHRELVLAGFKSEEVTDQLIEKYLDLVHRYSLAKEFTHDSCTRAAFGIYVQLRMYCELGQRARGLPIQHGRMEEPGSEMLWPETLNRDWERPQAKPVPYKKLRRPTKRKNDGNE